MSQTDPRVFVILPVHNRRSLTVKFAELLKKQSYPGIEFVLVDDGSRDGTSDAVVEVYPRAHVLKGDGNWWWGGSIAVAMIFLEKFKPRPDDTLLLINDDTEISESFVANGVQILKQQNKVLLLAKSLNAKTGEVVEAGSKIIWPLFRIVAAKSDAEINCAPTRGLMLKWQDYLEIGPWVPDVLPHYCSDFEFTCRALRKGFQIQTNPEFTLRMHLEATGVSHVKAVDSRDFWVQLLDMKSIRSPVTLSKFILLCCPWYFRPMAWLKVWTGAFASYFLFLTRLAR
jgi:GT2 family glycosyltransferase